MMSKKKHLDKLTKGAAIWKEWKKNYSFKNIDISSVSLSWTKLSGYDFSQVNLSEADLGGAEIQKGDFSEANLYKTDLTGANLNRANLRQANLSSAFLDNTDLSEADLSGANLSETDLREANLEEALLQRVNFSTSDLSHLDLSDRNLSDAIFFKAKLNRTNFSRSILTGANFKNTDLKKVIFNDTKLNKIEFQEADLSGHDLSDTCLRKTNFTDSLLNGTNLARADLSEAILSGAKLNGVNLAGAILHAAILHRANLSGQNFQASNLTKADLTEADLSNTNLTKANLSKACLKKVDLSGRDLSEVILSEANLSDADLSRTILSANNLSSTDLTDANLIRAEALGTNFSNAILTGACIEGWNIDSQTKLDHVICDYIFLKKDQQERRPSDPNRNFEPGEFTKLFQKVLETVDLIFNDGINWKAFLLSLTELQNKHGEENVDVQAIEKKPDGAFVVRIEVPPEANKADIEIQIKQLYKDKLQLLEAEYRAELKAKDQEIADHKKQSADMKEIAKLLASRPITVEAIKVLEKRNINTGGGEYRETILHNDSRYIETRGNSTYYENNSNNTDEINTLIATLREIIKRFPDEQREDAELELNALEVEIIEHKKQDPKNFFGRRLKRLVAVGTAAATIASGAAAFSGELNTFTENVLELGKKLKVPLELIQ